jgi:hypothetical protein
MVKVRQWTQPNLFKVQVTQKDLKLDEELSEDLQYGSSFFYFLEVLCESINLIVYSYTRYVRSYDNKEEDLCFYLVFIANLLKKRKLCSMKRF